MRCEICNRIEDETRLFKGADLDVGPVDYLAIESTYGDRNQPPRKESEKLFIKRFRILLIMAEQLLFLLLLLDEVRN